jgi:hypothetical protein
LPARDGRAGAIERRGSARFFHRGEPFHGAGGQDHYPAKLLRRAGVRFQSAIRSVSAFVVLDNVERVEQLESIVRCVDVTGRVLVTRPDSGT